MADYIELANSYYRLLKWVEATNAEKKNTALRSLDRIKKFLTESGVELTDLTGQPFSEGWAVNVMKIDQSVPDNELVFTKMLKPIIQIKGELSQEGEVYAGRLEKAEIGTDETEAAAAREMPETPVEPTETDAGMPHEKGNALTEWFKHFADRIKAIPMKTEHWITIGFGVVVLAGIILLACVLGGQSRIRNDITAVSDKIDGIAVIDSQDKSEASSFVTYKICNGKNEFIITQPIGVPVNSTIEVEGVPISVMTTNKK